MLRLLFLLLLASPASATGKLLIVGGGLDPGNRAIHRAFIDAALPGGDIVIVPSASANPAATGFITSLVRHGVPPERIILAHVAEVDDPDTRATDESRWKKGATDPAEIAKLANAGAIWFSGGDQLRTLRLLTDAGTDTPFLAAVRARHLAGAVIGGSSAGAAIMSRAMILRGESLGALLKRPSTNAMEAAREGEALVMGRGLGFLTTGLVDQHFSQRARLGRLARALMTLPAAERLGYGIDEDSALLIDGTAATVLGSGSVTLLDARRAQFAPAGGISGLGLAIASRGDRIDLASATLTPAPGRTPRPMGTAFTPADSGGIAAAPRPLADILVQDLLTNPGTGSLSRRSFLNEDSLRFRFTRLPGAVALASPDGAFSLSGLRLDILRETAPAPRR
ncbi:cyanophycinase [Sandaracinobacteroides saxicola]|uniref:Cyanophycinase n=1 Tax=Sandaracinobacteroides saxicola TaxID=2759707 RepID=A0A7G5IL76_9SPHN|nr:cyanophycinase [Sandaracinobacteroides saxicola]QMW24118.1 cyanophycinase [Sandaracinobacteroides saxicola]